MGCLFYVGAYYPNFTVYSPLQEHNNIDAFTNYSHENFDKMQMIVKVITGSLVTLPMGRKVQHCMGKRKVCCRKHEAGHCLGKFSPLRLPD